MEKEQSRILIRSIVLENITLRFTNPDQSLGLKVIFTSIPPSLPAPSFSFLLSFSTMRSGANYRGGTLELTDGNEEEEEEQRRRKIAELDRGPVNHLDETQQRWLLYRQGSKKGSKKKRKVDLGCAVCSCKAFKWTLFCTVIAILVISIPTILKFILKHKPRPPPPDNYTLALNKALLFFNAQK
ncbi:hypothetical protein LINGRAHAP2_LOCUS7808 [Linum grandiflorum]